MFSATGAERLSLGFQPVTKTGAALFLWNAADPPSRRYPNPALRDGLFSTETKAHHAASRPFAVEARASSPERKERRKSAALLACEAARTMARLSSRSTSSQEPM